MRETILIIYPKNLKFKAKHWDTPLETKDALNSICIKGEVRLFCINLSRHASIKGTWRSSHVPNIINRN